MSGTEKWLWSLKFSHALCTQLLRNPLLEILGTSLVKQLQMVLYKPDCDSNDCELPSGQATSSTLAKVKGVACGEAAGY